MDIATAFLGFMKFHEKTSVVLVVNHHVISSEDVAASSFIQLHGTDVAISVNNLMVKNTYKHSPKKKVCINTQL